MAIYDSEEEQLEQIKKWWEANQSAVLTGVVAAAVLVAALNFWEKYQTDNRNRASQTFQELLTSVQAEKVDSVEKLAEKLQSEHADSAYTEFAQLLLVKEKAQKGDYEGAKTLLQAIIKQNNLPELQHICRLRLLQLMLATKQYEEGLQLIASVDPAARESFSAYYDELQGDLYLALDRKDEARSAYQSALRSGQATPLTQFKLDDLTAPSLEQLNPPG